jgi:Glu-tRNA(Gln) amidotransferase subunit E-like FAD-binding protein
MYPDTDTPPLPIPDSMVVEIREQLPETPWARRDRYERLGLDPPVALRLARAPWAPLFDALSPMEGKTARRLASTLEKRIPYHRRRRRLEAMPDAERLEPMVRAVESGKVRPEAMDRIFDALLEQPLLPADEVLAPFRVRGDDTVELERRLSELMERVAPLAGKPTGTVVRWAMGELMPHFLGRLEPAGVEEGLVRTLRETASEIEK